MTDREWVASYLDNLAASHRLHPLDSRYLDPAKRAAGNGWTPEVLAAAVSSTMARKSGVSSPPMLALRIMSDLADGAPIDLRPVAEPFSGDDWRANLPRLCPHQAAYVQGLNPNQCKACRAIAGEPQTGPRDPGTCPVCWLPGCKRHLLPPLPLDHFQARVALLQYLSGLPAGSMSEDDREGMMTDLIASQGGPRAPRARG